MLQKLPLSATLRYAHLSPKHLTSAVRVLDPTSDRSLDSYLTIQTKQKPEEVLAGVRNEGDATQKPLDRSVEEGMVPKAGLEPARLSPHAPQTCVSAIPPLRHGPHYTETARKSP